MTPHRLAGLVLVLLFLSGCAARQTEGQSPAPVFFLPGGAPLTEGQMAARLGRFDFILVGERHNSALSHEAQSRILELAVRGGRPPVVGLEMLPRDKYDACLDDFVQERVCLEYLPLALNWEQEWGYDFNLYAPLFALARNWTLPLRGLNLENELRKKVSRGGLAALSPAEKRRLPAAVALPPPGQRESLAAIFAMHAGIKKLRLDGDAAPSLELTVRGLRRGQERPVPLPLSLKAPFERFMLVQSLWDGVMAEQALRLNREFKRPVLILAGSGHVAYGHGIAHRLRLFAPEARILSIMPFAGAPQEADAALGDIFYYREHD